MQCVDENLFQLSKRFVVLPHVRKLFIRGETSRHEFSDSSRQFRLLKYYLCGPSLRAFDRSMRHDGSKQGDPLLDIWKDLRIDNAMPEPWGPIPRIWFEVRGRACLDDVANVEDEVLVSEMKLNVVVICTTGLEA